ncbi:MAG: copper amine oxidase N-terminal domain-containing protein [Oscillospiraceae bacterium]|jgi:hypothetical protein|nr:copper amine oxidase N-terminal domain-containing protein [Oscillospiraceae bacterium]
MRRKLTALACAAIAAALLVVSPSGAVTEVYFTSVGDRLLPLTAADMPVNLNGVMYVPYTVFNASALGTSVFFSQSSQIVQILNSSKELKFNLQTMQTEDANGRIYTNSPPIIRNGKAYVPASFVSGFFGLKYSFISNTGVESIVRIYTADSLYPTDGEFVAAAYTRMKLYLNDYLTYTPPSSSPYTPPSNSPTPSPTPNYSDIQVSLVFIGAERGYDILTTLGALPSAFYLTADEIRLNDDFVRRLIGVGKQIGLVELEGSAVTAAEYLREVAVYRSELILTEVPDTIAVADAYELLASARRNSSITFEFAADADTAESLEAFLTELKRGQYFVSN